MRAKIIVILALLITVIPVCAQIKGADLQLRFSDKIGPRSDGGFSVFLILTNVSGSGLRLILPGLVRYEVKYCADIDCSPKARQLLRSGLKDPVRAGSFTGADLGVNETMELKEDFYTGEERSFDLKAPGIYRIRAVTDLGPEDEAALSNVLVLNHSPSGSWSILRTEEAGQWAAR